MSEPQRHRSSEDGEFVTPEFAAANPATTQAETIDPRLPAVRALLADWRESLTLPELRDSDGGRRLEECADQLAAALGETDVSAETNAE